MLRFQLVHMARSGLLSLSLSLSLFSPLTSRSDLDWPVPKRRSRRGKRIFFRESRILLIFAKVGEKDKNKWVEVS